MEKSLSQCLIIKSADSDNNLNDWRVFVVEFISYLHLLLLHITAVGRHWGPVIATSARIGSLRPGSPLLFSNEPKECLRCMNHRQSTHHLAFDISVKLHWWPCGDKVIGYNRYLNTGSRAEHPNHSTADFHSLHANYCQHNKANMISMRILNHTPGIQNDLESELYWAAC
jgi:hypothetical protein